MRYGVLHVGHWWYGDISERRGLRCGTEKGTGHVCQSSEMGLNEDWPIKRPCILIGGERKKSLGRLLHFVLTIFA